MWKPEPSATSVGWVATALAALLAGCEINMFEQPRYDAFESSALFEDGMSERPRVAHTVARGQLEEDEALYSGTENGVLVDRFPFAITRDNLARGHERFEIYCAPCHGALGDGKGMIARRGFKAPPSYHDDRLRQAPVGYFFFVITSGFGAMFSYAEDVKPADRWNIIAYIRALQLSQNASFADLTADERHRLLGASP
jgi:mono/diheme cytochrome c family protein